MERLYTHLLQNHFQTVDQMAFLPGPRQVGKTTIAKQLCQKNPNSLYLNWDITKDREIILQDTADILRQLPGQSLSQTKKPLIIFDEIHKFKNWKNLLKGFYDETHAVVKTLVTGSAKLDIFKYGNDSLMGRYFLYHVHPFTTNELLQKAYKKRELVPPAELGTAEWDNLYKFGGYPEPFIKSEESFFKRWQRLRMQQLFEEDIRALSDIRDLAQMELLATLLISRAGQQLNYSALAKMIKSTIPTVTRWVDALKAFYYCFTIQPWHKNISRSLIKEPKVYLWDWAVIDDRGAKIENFIASHLHKAVQLWTDIGLDSYGLFYLRDKEKREVDFLVTKNDVPWIMVEVKSSEKESLSEYLYYFQSRLKAEHVFQVVFDMPYVDKDCFSQAGPIKVPARTFLSQLM